MKLRTKIMMVSILPIVVLGVFIYVFSSIKITSSMENEVFTGLNAACESLRTQLYNLNSDDFYLDGDILMKGDVDITNKTDIVDNVKKETQIVTTVFFGDTRYATSVTKDNGDRVLYTQAGEKVINTVVKGGSEYSAANVDVVGTDFYAYYKPIEQPSTGETIGMVFAGKNQVMVEKDIKSVTNSILIGTIIMVIIAGLLSFFVSLKITQALDASISIIDNVSNGNLAVDIDGSLLERKDELGKMTQCINNLKNELAVIVSGLKRQSESLYSTSGRLDKTSLDATESVGQVERAIHEIADGASSQADETQRATENVILMGNMVEDTSAQVQELLGVSESMSEAGQRAINTLDMLSQINKKASGAIETVYEQTNTTNESVLRIREATALITEIADETNLLSLNASIEAARAGEQGRGFAVVAGQISKLAEQSNESASKIAQIITELIKDSTKSVETMDEIREIMQEQDEDVRKTQEAFDDVRAGIAQSTEGMKVIASKTKSLDEARINVVDVVQNLTAIAEENAAGTQETSASATEFGSLVGGIQDETRTLKDVADGIEQSMSIFQL